MAAEFGFTLVDATLPIHQQQEQGARIITEQIDLAKYRGKV